MTKVCWDSQTLACGHSVLGGMKLFGTYTNTFILLTLLESQVPWLQKDMGAQVIPYLDLGPKG